MKLRTIFTYAHKVTKDAFSTLAWLSNFPRVYCGTVSKAPIVCVVLRLLHWVALFWLCLRMYRVSFFLWYVKELQQL